MMVTIRPLALALLLIHNFLVHVDCWSGYSFFGSNGNDDADDGSIAQVGTATKRSLSSFQNYTHPIPIDQPITPRGRRDIEIAVKAHTWPTTIFSPLCETWSYLDAGDSISISDTKSSSSKRESSSGSDSLAWRYLDSLVEQGGISSLDSWVNGASDNNEVGQLWTYKNSTVLALEIASRVRKSETYTLDENLLPLALSLRARSPHCEMHRSLARNAAISFGLYDPSAVNIILPAAFAVVSRVGNDLDGGDTMVVLDSHVILDASLLRSVIDKLTLERGGVESKAHDSSLLMPLPDEELRPTNREGNDSIIAILYGQFGTTAFASLYRTLKDLNVAFAVRHMGHVPYEEEVTLEKGVPSRAVPTALQGYGVRLDIRNVEYKAFDDGVIDSSKNGDAEPDWNEAGHDPAYPARREYLAGVNLSSLLGRFHKIDGPLASDLLMLQTALIQSHPSQLRSESIVPPAWQRRPLSLQAATVIASSPDPLETLRGVSENLPSVAHSLSNVQVPDSLEDLAEEATALATKVGAVSPGWGDAAFGLFVNNRIVDVERPSFNVFELLGVLRVEDKRLRELELKILPILKDGLSMWKGNEEDKASAEWAGLNSARRLFDMGMEHLKQMGKTGFAETALTENKEEVEEGDDNPGAVEKFRVDVGRGGRNAIIYLNDIEKDPQYRSWPVSMQEMLYRSQFGAAPTVRRNLFTMLLVLDPGSKSDVPAFNVVEQLMNSKFPLRLGVLLVNGEDFLKGSASPPEEWNDGERIFHARDSTLILKHIAKEIGGMAAISCLMHMTEYVAQYGAMSVKEYVNLHIHFLGEMRVVQDHNRRNQIQNEIVTLLERGPDEASSKLDEVTYESALQFAVERSIQPGMTFLNGLPFPDSSKMDSFGSGVNDILQYEQRYIMGLIMKGVITDTHPKSIYATVLSGDKLFKKFHPLLNESSGKYVSILGTDSHSLILPTNTAAVYDNIDALFIVEGVFDISTPTGIDYAISFLELMSSPPAGWHDSKRIFLSFRILPSVPPTSTISQLISNVLCNASHFDPADIIATIKVLQGARPHEKLTDVVNSLVQDKIDKKVIESLARFATGETNCPVTTPALFEESNFYAANGRVYVPSGRSPISVSDIKMLCNIEIDRTHAITKTILPHLLPELPDDGTLEKDHALVLHQAIGTLSASLGEMMSVSSSSQGLHDIAATFDSLRIDDKNPLSFSWNEESSSTGHLQVRVSAILDPLTEPTQRVAPLLLAIRDVLKLPLVLIIAPRKVVQNDAPFSSYYRFVADPFAFPESKPPKAVFENLPTNHVLTLRMDVPELWDVQQAFAVQDADNLRCDFRVGCGDDANLSTSESEAGTDDIERATIEYTLKSLLFFGQCYDVSKSTPPNGLQLTVERSKSIAKPEPTSAAELQPNGDVSFSSHAGTQNEHTDTLVMKTVGYWQVRANPGVWNMHIAPESRGAEMYDMVEGTVDRRGRIKLAKEGSTSETTTKTLVMKDFTNPGRLLLVKRRQGYEEASLFHADDDLSSKQAGEHDFVHVFSLATGHAYERLLKIMMLSVTKRTSSPVKFWLFENFLSPSFKASAKFMAQRIGCEVEFVTYKWPEWLRGQTEKQRIIWGYKILFLDVLFPLDVKKIIYVDADQVVRGDLTELWNLDLDGAPYGYTPMCDSREETLGYAFWRTGFWQSHLRGKPYHISALYVVDLERFRRELVGDKLRSIYQNLSADPNSLANLDQDLPNYAQHDVRIFSLPQKWLWCESWCSDETKAEAMTIDLCNNPEHKEPKISMAKRIISGDLFEESWEELDAEVESYNHAYLVALATRGVK